MGSVHSISPTRKCDSPSLAGGLAEAPPDRSQDFWPAQPGPARTSPTDRRDQHAHGEARLAHGCKNRCGMATPSEWLARLSVSHRSAADSRCIVDMSIRCRALGKAPPSSILRDFASDIGAHTDANYSARVNFGDPLQASDAAAACAIARPNQSGRSLSPLSEGSAGYCGHAAERIAPLGCARYY